MELNHYFNAADPLRPYTHSLPASAGTFPPVNALRGEAPPIVKGAWPRESGGAWVQGEDHRKREAGGGIPPEAAQDATEYWLPGDTWETPARTMTEVGALPKGALLERPKKTPEEERAIFLATFPEAVQCHLDAFARTRDYDGILAAASYATSKNPVYASEGQYAVEARDETWNAAFAIIEAVQSGERPTPEAADALAELPLAWPEAAAPR